MRTIQMKVIHFVMSSTLTSIYGKYYEYHVRERDEQGLSIGGYESEFLVDLVASYLFEKAKANVRPTIYHGIYRDGGLVVFKGKKKASEIKDWLEYFQQTVNKSAGNQHLQSTAGICTKEDNSLTPSKEE